MHVALHKAYASATEYDLTRKRRERDGWYGLQAGAELQLQQMCACIGSCAAVPRMPPRALTHIGHPQRQPRSTSNLHLDCLHPLGDCARARRLLSG